MARWSRRSGSVARASNRRVPGARQNPRKVDIDIDLNPIRIAIEFDDRPGIILTEFLADSGLWARPCPRKTRPGIVPECCHRFGRDATSISPGGSLAPP